MAYYLPGGWSAQANVFVNRTYVQASVFNHTNRPIVCSGQVYGRTINGVTLSAWMNNRVIYPRMNAQAYVYTNNFQPFLNGWANIWCRFL